MKGKNVLVNYLTLLGVRYTDVFTNQFFNEHPHKFNLFGLSKMLSDYGVENAATQIKEKENDISEIQTPFIAQFGGDFVAVHKVYPKDVSFFWKGANHILAIAKFIEAWTGIVLLAESSEKSIEPDYKEHRKTETLNLLKRILFMSAIGLIAVLAYIILLYYTSIGISLLLIINIAGLFVSRLLLLKQMHVESQYADRICSMFKQKDCNNVLESEAAKLFGIIGWSEIGCGYFLANILLMLYSPALITSIALINILTLTYTLWSVWYQKAKAKQWCVLCLIIQVLLWAIFAVNLLFGYLKFPELLTHSPISTRYTLITTLFFTACCYFASVLGINMLVPKLNTEKTIQSIRQSLNSMKADESIFITLLKQQPYYETDDCDSVIRFGHPKSKLQIVVLSNPYCNPCAKMHKRIEELLHQVNNEISVRYILSAFEENLNSTNKYLIASCLESQTGSIMQIFNDWFEKGKALKDDYFKNMPLDMDKPEIEVEFVKHEAWKEKAQIRSTPTILVNGYQLPETYKVEDLRYFTDLDL